MKQLCRYNSDFSLMNETMVRSVVRNSQQMTTRPRQVLSAENPSPSRSRLVLVGEASKLRTLWQGFRCDGSEKGLA